MRNTDVSIVGGGLAGSMTAAMLRRAGRDFVMIDPDQSYPWDFRCEKLDSSQAEILRRAGLADVVLPSATLFDRLWVARLGRFVEKRANEQFGIFYDALVNSFRAEVPPTGFVQGKVASISTSSDRQIVTLSDGQEFSARLAVLATGPNHGLRKSLGIERKILSPCHSVSIGFDMKPAGRAAFDFPALTYFPDRVSGPISYLTLFPIGAIMRANLFVYHDARDPWLDEFRRAPQATSFDAMPGLRAIIGDFEIASVVKVRPIDLYETTGYRQAGVVLVGDAFSSSCPAAGTGTNKVFVDVERLCNVHVPRWLSTAGMGVEKIGAFYDDPDKRASDKQSMSKANWLRSVSMSHAARWRARRVLRVMSGYGRGMFNIVKERMLSRT